MSNLALLIIGMYFYDEAAAISDCGPTMLFYSWCSKMKNLYAETAFDRPLPFFLAIFLVH